PRPGTGRRLERLPRGPRPGRRQVADAGRRRAPAGRRGGRIVSAASLTFTSADLLDLARAIDPSTLMEDLGFEPDPSQRNVLRSTHDRILQLCARQCGKSTVTAILGLHAALYQPDSLVLCVSPSLRQSGELFRKLVGFYNDLGRPRGAVQDSATTLSLRN